ncbi:hypothetical protein H311_02555, partial [Anncaliia algerae PRA109]
MAGKGKDKDLNKDNDSGNNGVTDRMPGVEERVEQLIKLLNTCKLNSDKVREFKVYDGREKGEVASKWLEQFDPFVDDWSDEIALAHFKSALDGVARLWLLGAIDNEVKNKKEFKNEFENRFCKKKIVKVNELFKLINRGSKPSEYVEFILKIRSIHKNVHKISLEEIVETLKESTPIWIQKELCNVKNWNEFIDAAENIEKLAKEKLKKNDVWSKEGKLLRNESKKVICYICKGPHYKNECPSKKQEKESDKNKTRNQKYYTLNIEVGKTINNDEKRPKIGLRCQKKIIEAL